MRHSGPEVYRPGELWYGALRRIGWDIGRVANLYWTSHVRGENLIRVCRHLQWRTRWAIDHYVLMGCARCDLAPISLFDDRPIPLEWADIDPVFRNHAHALHVDFHHCGVTDHGLRAEIFASVYNWVGDEFDAGRRAFVDEEGRHDVKFGYNDFLGWFIDTKDMRKVVRRTARPRFQYERVAVALEDLEERMWALESTFSGG